MKQRNHHVVIVSLNFHVVLVFLLALPCSCVDEYYELCKTQSCGTGPNISYPFRIQTQNNSYCGFPDFELNCSSFGYPLLRLDDQDYVVENIFYENSTIQLYNAAFYGPKNGCFPKIMNYSLEGTPYTSRNNRSYSELHFLFDCNMSDGMQRDFEKYKIGCNNNVESGYVLFGKDEELEKALGECRMNVIAEVEGEEFDEKNVRDEYEDVMKRGFELSWAVSDCSVCKASGGICGFNTSTNQFACFCTDRPHLVSCKPSNVGRSWIWIAVVVPIVVILLVSTLLTYKIMRRRRLKAAEKKQREDFLHQFDTTDSFIDAQQNEYNRGENRHDVKMFGFGSIMAATNNLSSDNKLGEGGFGPVYKGKLLDGREIAVKRLSRTSGQGMIEFKNELILISKLQHTNLVRVLGCCIHQKEKMLVYEYMPNKSLDFFLFDPERKKGLHWPIRFNIIEGVAQGLLYLHKYSRMKVIHRDLKASNVLLDENMNPKIADFGMARIFKSNEAQANTNRVVGTYGYMSPEYAMEGTFSIKSDVFSFGVLILEIVSGRRNNNFYNPHIPLNLIGYAWELWKEGDALELKDKSPGEGFPSNQILRAIQVGLLCVQENAVDRPTMQQVISMFGSVSMALTSPKKPAYFIGRNDDDQQQSDKQKQDSVQDYSITSVEAR